jgi:hypothetical protein
MITKYVVQILAILLCIVFALGGIAEKDQRHYLLPASVAMLVIAILAEVVWGGHY